MNNAAIRAASGSHFRLAVTATAGAIVLGMLLATPAAADEDNGILLELSRDGVNFTSGTVSDIFATSGGMVPGESRQGTVWVRNASRDAAQFSLAVNNTGAALSQALPDYLSMATASGGSNASMDSLPKSGGLWHADRWVGPCRWQLAAPGHGPQPCARCSQCDEKSGSHL